MQCVQKYHLDNIEQSADRNLRLFIFTYILESLTARQDKPEVFRIHQKAEFKKRVLTPLTHKILKTSCLIILHLDMSLPRAQNTDFLIT